MEQEFVKQCKNLVMDLIKGLHTALPGEILSFDPQSGLASVRPLAKAGEGNNRIDYPSIYGVPVLFPQGWGQKVSLAFPLQAGDGCLLIMAEQALDYWLYGQETGLDLRFDLSNALAIPGLFSLPSALVAEACAEQALILEANNKRIKISSQGVEITGDLTVNGQIRSSGDVVAKYDLPDERVSLLGGEA